MKKTSILTILAILSTHYLLAQGSIDIDTNIQMGVAGTEHVKITETNFSIHQDEVNPLIYGDFVTGRVGIGTNSPDYPLSVYNDSGVSSGTHSIASFGRFMSGNGNAGLHIWYEGNGTDVTRTQLYFPGQRDVTFQLYDNGVRDVLHLKTNGRVGIGTTSPSTTLDVKGTMKISSDGTFSGPGLDFSFFSGNVKQSSARNYTSGDRRNIEISNAWGNWRLRAAGDFNIVNWNPAWSYYDAFFIESTNGNIGIGTTTPTTKLYVAGSTWSTTGWSSSDLRWKKDISDIENATTTLKKLRAVGYYWRSKEFDQIGFDDKQHFGVIAQEVEKMIPELVNTNHDGFKSVDYNSFIGLLIKAIQEKDTEIEELRTQSEELRSEMSSKIDQLQAQINQIINQSETRHSREGLPVGKAGGNLTGSK